jgi:hypothetical protein
MARKAAYNPTPISLRVVQPLLWVSPPEPRLTTMIDCISPDRSQPPTMIVTVPGGKCTTIAIGRLARAVAALPPRQFMPLNEALARAKDLLGSWLSAAHDLTQHARAAGRLITAVRVIWPDRTEQVFLLRRAFWQWHEIFDSSLNPGLARVHGHHALPGQWHFFVGRRRFDRLYSTAAPSKPVTRKRPEPEQWLIPMREKFFEVPPKRRAAWVRDVAYPQMRRELGEGAPWETWETLKRVMYPGRKKKQKKI